jgi:microcompartment protein CcmL/EutN
MKRASALAVLDFGEVPAGLDATDAMLKKAPVAFFRSGSVTAGRYLTLLGGTPASVEEALAEGLARAGAHLLDHLYLADVHPRLLDALEGRRGEDGTGALLVLETATASSVVLACEKALKGTLVDLVEVRLSDSGLAGKGLALLRGDLHELEAAVDLVSAALPGAAGLSYRVLARPHDALAREAALGTAFAASRFVDLGGEEAS